MMFSNLFQVILLKECCLSWFGNEKCVMGIPATCIQLIKIFEYRLPGWVLLGLEQCIKIPETGFNKVIGWHLSETHL